METTSDLMDELHKCQVLLEQSLAENARLRAEIDAANAQEPFCTITHTAEDDLKTYRTELHYRDDVTIASIPSHLALYARPLPAQQSPAVAVPDNWSAFDQEDFDLVLDWLKQQELEINVGQVQGDFDEYVGSSAGILLSLIESSRDYFKRIAIKSPSIIKEPKLDKPARVNATNFMTGVPVRMVIEAANRYYDWRKENPPEKDGDMQKQFFVAIDDIKKPAISTEQLLEIAASAITSVQSFTGLAANHAQRWLDNEGVELVEKLKFNSVLTPSPRITEHDAREMALSAWRYWMNNCDRTVDNWIEDEGLDLINKLNEAKHD